MNYELALAPAHAPQRPACAWFIPGAAAELWLTALAQLPIDAARARFLIVPQSATDRVPLGALIIDTGATSRGEIASREASLALPPYAQPYGCLTARLFVPIDAVVRPAITPRELEGLLAGDAYYVWHPAAGLTPFALAEAVLPASLLRGPAETAADWSRATPGLALNERLQSLTASVTHSLSELMQEARDDIGAEAENIKELPPSPREPPPGLIAQVQSRSTTLLARLALWFSGLWPAANPGRESQTVADPARSWATVFTVVAFILLAVVVIATLVSWPHGQTPPSEPIRAITEAPKHIPPAPPRATNPHPPPSPTPPSYLFQFFPLLGGLLGILFLLSLLGFLARNAVQAFNSSRWASTLRELLDWLLRLGIAAIVIASVAYILTLPALGLVAFLFVLVEAAILCAVFGPLLFCIAQGLFGGQAEQGDNLPANPQRTAPARSARPGWFSRLRTWATTRIEQAKTSIDAARHREIERLLHALETDPDAGLKFALPLAGAGFMAAASPGTQLTQRNVDFRSGAGSGRGPADVWALREEYRRKLTQRYRELANREISLGRHRRAAYIFAELLGDWQAAAKTLADGRHFREAATVYDERLQRPLDAAKCLAGGGLLPEAIVIYQRLGHHETVGDLFAQLEQHDDAARAYRQAVDVRRAAADPLGAAKLLEEKLLVPEEAWSELADGWPKSPQAERCFRAAFDWMERHQDPERAKNYLQQAATAARPLSVRVRFVELAAELATSYSEPGVCAAAAETTLQTASPLLPEASAADVKTLTAAISALAADDRLLARDCQRYDRHRAGAAAVARPTTPLRLPPKQLQLKLETKLPLDHVSACLCAGRTIYAAGRFGNQLKITRGTWHGHFHFAGGSQWLYPYTAEETPILLAIDPSEQLALSVHIPGTAPVGHERVFPATDEFSREVKAGNFAGCTRSTLALFNTGHAIYRADWSDAGLTFYTMRGAYTLVHTEQCTRPEGANRLPLPFQEFKGILYFGVGPILYAANGGQPLELATFHDAIVQLAVSPRHTLVENGAVVAFEHGAAFLWELTAGASATRFADDLAHPQVLMHRDGWIIVASRHRGEVYITQGRSLLLHASVKWADQGEIVSILPGPVSLQFSVVDSAGHLRTFAIPAHVAEGVSL